MRHGRNGEVTSLTAGVQLLSDAATSEQCADQDQHRRHSTDDPTHKSTSHPCS